jgi:hypothetical protein
MPKIIFISPHFKSEASNSKHISYLVRYIATREGVSPVTAEELLLPATEKQTNLIAQLVQDFPVTKKQFEYEDYLCSPTRENADDFIRTALEQNLNQLSKRQNHVDYIGHRPGVAKLETHGLFDSTGRKLIVSQVQKEIAEHPGVVWTPVISLRREDAHAMDLESPESWRAMLSSCAADLAKGYKIRPEHLKWYAAFHDNSHHPHVHMILYSTEPTQGFLTKQGITQIRSVLAQRIFPGQLEELYAADTKQRDALKAEARALYLEVIEQMSEGTLQNDHIETLTIRLAEKLAVHRGKLQYGYLQAPLKALVDEIVDELAQDPRIAEAYRLWYEIRTDILSTYYDDTPEISPLSTQKEFKPVRNMVIAEAAKLIGKNSTHEVIPPSETSDSEKQDAPETTQPQSPHHHEQRTASTPSPSGQSKDPQSAVQAATRLLHHMSSIFQNSIPPMGNGKIQIDEKLRRKLRQKKIAQGHKADDHEDIINMTL